jgi:tRNA (guanine-N7-)-methyltransferase
MTSQNRPLRSFGRTRSRTIKPAQAALIDTLLPGLQIRVGETGQVFLDQDLSSDREVWLEIGFGGGEHLAGQARAHPDVMLLGAEPFLNGAASALRHIAERELKNVRLHIGDARDLMDGLADAAVSRVFILFPDPWPKARHHKRRLVSSAFVAGLSRIVRRGGTVRFATDWADYADAALLTFLAEPAFSWRAEGPGDWRDPPCDHITTRYQQKALGDIAPVFFDFERK